VENNEIFTCPSAAHLLGNLGLFFLDLTQHQIIRQTIKQASIDLTNSESKIMETMWKRMYLPIIPKTIMFHLILSNEFSFKAYYWHNTDSVELLKT